MVCDLSFLGRSKNLVSFWSHLFKNWMGTEGGGPLPGDFESEWYLEVISSTEAAAACKNSIVCILERLRSQTGGDLHVHKPVKKFVSCVVFMQRLGCLQKSSGKCEMVDRIQVRWPGRVDWPRVVQHHFGGSVKTRPARAVGRERTQRLASATPRWRTHRESLRHRCWRVVSSTWF
jgi:hypothetical protein